MFSLLPLVKNTAVVVGCVVVGVAAATADIIKKYCCCVWCITVIVGVMPILK